MVPVCRSCGDHVFRLDVWFCPTCRYIATLLVIFVTIAVIAGLLGARFLQ